jgi:hypothetical protein
MEDTLTMRDVAIMTGLHKNTIRNYVKAGKLKATLIQEGKGKDRYLIRREDLYNCAIPNILAHLGPLEVRTRVEQAEAERRALGVDAVGEIMRLNRELQNAVEELGGLRIQVPMLKAAQIERDQLAQEIAVERQNNAVLATKAADLKQALAEAQANMKWGARRRLQKASKAPALPPAQ